MQKKNHSDGDSVAMIWCLCMDVLFYILLGLILYIWRVS